VVAVCTVVGVPLRDLSPAVKDSPAGSAAPLGPSRVYSSVPFPLVATGSCSSSIHVSTG